MKFCRLAPFFAVFLFIVCNLRAARAQDASEARKLDNASTQAAQLKLIKAPAASFPAEAVKKNIEGKVSLSIVGDANGRVSDAKVLSGPPEFYQVAWL